MTIFVHPCQEEDIKNKSNKTHELFQKCTGTVYFYSCYGLVLKF
jgi:hypothetical protein